MAHQARKRFGQNFLQDSSYQRRIADSLHLSEGAKCLEIGPGKGAITGHLLQRFKTLEAIELDRDLAGLLRRKYSESELVIHQGDVLKLDLNSVSTSQRLSIIGNLPYNISSPLLFHIIQYLDIIDEMVFMLQKEVVDRITAAPGSKTYGRLSVTVGLWLESEKLFDVPPGAFFPVPKVTSSVVRLRPRRNVDQTFDPIIFEKIVRSAFVKRRKIIRNSLSQWVSEEQLHSLGIEPQLRAEQLSIETFVRLAECATRESA